MVTTSSDRQLQLHTLTHVSMQWCLLIYLHVCMCVLASLSCSALHFNVIQRKSTAVTAFYSHSHRTFICMLSTVCPSTFYCLSMSLPQAASHFGRSGWVASVRFCCTFLGLHYLPQTEIHSALFMLSFCCYFS